jgi:GntR family carbon starvation induced transcriptional regulator
MNMIDETSARETSATRGAYLSLREMILTGELRAGEKLKIDKLRAMLDLGASPIREALSLLTSDMLVERIDQRGFRAASASQANFQEILMLRSTLEDMALRKSIANATSEWEERLVLSHHRMNKAVPHGTAAFEAAHKAFHMALLDNSGSPMLLKYCGQLYDLNIRYRYLAASSEQYVSRDISSEHAEILEAALGHDADLAVDRLLTHYALTGEYLSPRLGNL